MAFIRSPTIRVKLRDPKRFQQGFEFKESTVLMIRQDIRQHFTGLMVNGVPQPALLFLVADKTPHFIGFGFDILPLAQSDEGLRGLELSQFYLIDCFQVSIFFLRFQSPSLG